MASKHTHCYSNYVNHILNNSPTKITYTFSKTQRFSPSLHQPKAPIDSIIQKSFRTPNKIISHEPIKQNLTSDKKLTNNFIQKEKQDFYRYPATTGQSYRKKQTNRSRSKSQNKEVYPFQNYLNNQIISGFDQGKKILRSKSTKAVIKQRQLTSPSPHDTKKTSQKKKKICIKKESLKTEQNKKILTEAEAQQNRKKDTHVSFQLPNSSGLGNNRYLKYSPYYLQQYVRNNGQENSLSRKKMKIWNRELSKSKQKKKHRKIRTSTIVLEQMDHPSKHITGQGYYPLGIQINPNGAYVSSTYRNVPVHSFGKSPAKNDKSSTSLTAKKFSTTPDKNKTRMPNGAQLYPESTSYNKNYIDKKANKQIKPTEQRFVPFSQFGNPPSYRN